MAIGIARAIGYGILIWLTGFVWGSIVFMTPVLNSISPIPYVSNYPAISFPLLVVWFFVAAFLAKRLLAPVESRARAGIKLGFVFAGLNVLLDFLVLVLALKAGFAFFSSLTVWIAYGMLFAIPIFVGRSMKD